MSVIPGGSDSKEKNPPAMQEIPVQSLGREDPQENGMATHSVFLPGEFHGQKSLVVYSPRVTKYWTRQSE